MSSTFLIFFKIFFNLSLTSLRTRQGFGASFISPSTVSSLYHILTVLSRGILNFFSACGSRDIRDMISACTVWFTFVFRTPTPRAVGSWDKGLTRSRGHPFSRSPCPPLLYPYCITTWAVCQGVSYIFSEFFFESTYARATLAMASIRLRLPSPLDNDSIPQTAPEVNMAKCTKMGIQIN